MKTVIWERIGPGRFEMIGSGPLVEHAVETFKIVPQAPLAVVPDASHYALFSEPDNVKKVNGARKICLLNPVNERS